MKKAAGVAIWTVMPVSVSMVAAEAEKVVRVKGDTILVLVGFLLMVSMMREMTVLAGIRLL